MEGMKIRYDGQAHQIEANTLINSLLHFTTIVQEVNRFIDPDKKVQIKINATKEGSFVIDLTIIPTDIAEKVAQLFTRENIAYAAMLVENIGKVFEIAKFLKGLAAARVEVLPDKTVQVENNYGTVIIIEKGAFDAYSSPGVIEALKSEFQSLNADPSITGFELLDKNDETMVSVEREDISELSAIDREELAADERSINRTAVLTIVALSFDLNKKWEFYFEGNKILAKVDDDEFKKAIDRGERFAKGDQLEAVIEIRQVFDTPAQVYANRSYKVTRIIQHIPRPEQPGLFPKEV